MEWKWQRKKKRRKENRRNLLLSQTGIRARADNKFLNSLVLPRDICSASTSITERRRINDDDILYTENIWRSCVWHQAERRDSPSCLSLWPGKNIKKSSLSSFSSSSSFFFRVYLPLSSLLPFVYELFILTGRSHNVENDVQLWCAGADSAHADAGIECNNKSTVHRPKYPWVILYDWCFWMVASREEKDWQIVSVENQ